jgi:hypothetical protein
VDGVPFRKLADEYSLSPAKTFRKIEKEMNQLPENSWLSATYCNRWSGRLVIDGKYVKVRGYDQKIPFIYCIDYLTHDIPVGLLAPSENLAAYVQLFNLIRTIHYPLQIVIADDNGSAREALKMTYPGVRLQLCNTHYLENIRQFLNIRTDYRYRQFFTDLMSAFKPEHHPQKRNAMLRRLNWMYGQYEYRVQETLVDIMSRYDQLFAYSHRMAKCPNTTNIIESYNSHLEARLKSIKGFNSFKGAERFLNAWMIRRRTKPFTDCGEPFKHLNGYCSLQMSMKKEAEWPQILGVKLPKKEVKN